MYLLLIIPAGFLLAMILGFATRIFERVTFRKGTFIAEYEAPHLLSAAELGYLVDKDFGNQELLATALTLAGEGLVDINKGEPGDPLLVARDDIRDSQLKVLDNGEQAVYSWIRSQRLRTVGWKNISDLFSKTLGARANFEHEVKQMLIDKGYLIKSSPFSFKSVSKYLYAASAFILLLTVAGSYWYVSNASTTGFNQDFRTLDINIGIITLVIIGALAWLPVAYYFRLLFLCYFYAANQPIAITDKFRQHWHEVAGFQMFIKTVEFSRLNADTNPYDAAMPYAVALGFKPDINKMTDLALRK